MHSCVSRCMLLHPGVSVCLQTTEMNVSKPLGCVVPPPPLPHLPQQVPALGAAAAGVPHLLLPYTPGGSHVFPPETAACVSLHCHVSQQAAGGRNNAGFVWDGRQHREDEQGTIEVVWCNYAGY